MTDVIVIMKEPWKIMWIIETILFIGGCRIILASTQVEVCDHKSLEQCETSASSLLKDPALVFPDSTESLDRVCRTWNDFTTCIYKYTNRCLTFTEKSRFNQSFKESVMAMSTLCQDINYRKEYLTYAPCIKKIATEEGNCGLQYRFLIDLFSGNTATMKQLCCARAKFKKCIILKTPGKCAFEANRSVDGVKKFGQPNDNEKNVTTFAIQVLDKSLAFIAQQCSVSSIKEDDCPGIVNVSNGQTFNRPNSKGPLHTTEKDNELQSSASNEKIHESNSTDFKLGKRPSSTPNSNFQLGQSQKSSPSTNSYTVSQEQKSSPSSNSNSVTSNSSPDKPKPEPQQNSLKQDQLSAVHNKGGEDKDGGVVHVLPSTILILCSIFSLMNIFLFRN